MGKAKPWRGLSLRNKQQPDSRDCVSFGQHVWMLLVPWLRVADSQTPHRMRSTLLVRLFIFLPVRTIPCLPSIQRHERFSDTKIEFAHVLASLPILMPSFEKSLWFCTDPTLSDGLPLPLPLVSSFFVCSVKDAPPAGWNFYVRSLLSCSARTLPGPFSDTVGIAKKHFLRGARHLSGFFSSP